MTGNIKDFIVNKYDEFFVNKPDGSDLEKTTESLAQQLLDGIQLGIIEPPAADMEWAISQVRQNIAPHRTKRRQSFKKNAEYFLDWLHNPAEGIHIDPFLDKVYPLGTVDGQDKAFRYWNEEDLEASVDERWDNVAAARRAAKEHEQVVEQLTFAMRRSRAERIQDVQQEVAA